jgi:rhodanese-related sulfurtransferase
MANADVAPSKRVGSTDPLSSQEAAEFFRTKLNAEWGPHDLKGALDRMAGRLQVIDTRDAQAYASEHIPGAIHIPTDELPQRLGELPKDRELIPYCWSITCHLATRAALFLSEKGYAVHELAGGIESWKKAEFPVEAKL